LPKTYSATGTTMYGLSGPASLVKRLKLNGLVRTLRPRGTPSEKPSDSVTDSNVGLAMTAPYTGTL
jgi:hypothetical protein